MDNYLKIQVKNSDKKYGIDTIQTYIYVDNDWYAQVQDPNLESSLNCIVKNSSEWDLLNDNKED